MPRKQKNTSSKQPAPRSEVGYHKLRQLCRTGRALFSNEVARQREYQYRPYQLKAAIRAVLHALAGHNSALELPTGTGKTLIACIAAVLWRYVCPESKVLLTVPSRTLVLQHYEVAKWVRRELAVRMIGDEDARNRSELRSLIMRADFLISTPGVLANAFSRQLVTPDAATFRLVVADEFDQFVVVDEEVGGSVARYSADFEKLRGALPKDVCYLVKSATLGVAEPSEQRAVSTKFQLRGEYLATELEPRVIVVPAKAYAPVVPFQRLNIVRVRDTNTSRLLAAVQTSIGATHFRIDEALGVTTDFQTIERMASTICEGQGLTRTRFFRSALDDRILASRLITLHCALTELTMMRTYIVEDLALDLGVGTFSGFVKTRQNEIVFIEEGMRLDDRRSVKRFRFQAGEKTRALLGIVASRSAKGERGVIMVRTTVLMFALTSLLSERGIDNATLYGELDDATRSAAISNFRDGKVQVLVMTRQTGGRGLDLPFADYALLFSPKAGASEMWQEMSRIRSNVTRPKDIYLLEYVSDYESLKTERVVHELTSQRRHIEVTIEPE